MDKNIDNEKNQDFLEILNNQESYDDNFNKKVLFFTTDSWLAQLGSRKNN